MVFMKNTGFTCENHWFLHVFMKTWYLRTFLVVILVKAVCGFNIIKRTFLRKPFSRWNKNFPAFAKNQFWHQMDPYGRYGRTTTSVLHGISKRIQWDESRGSKPRFCVLFFVFGFVFQFLLDHHFLIRQGGVTYPMPLFSFDMFYPLPIAMFRCPHAATC